MARVLLVGALWNGSTSLQRLKAIRAQGHRVIAIDSSPEYAQRLESTLVNRLFDKLFRLGFGGVGARDHAGVNECLLRAAHGESLDVLWLDKATTVHASTLARFRDLQPSCVVVGFSPDDMTSRHAQSRHFLQQPPYYDLFFTTKGFRQQALRDMGFSRVSVVGNSFDLHTHRPLDLTEPERRTYGAVVGFVGRYEPERARSIGYLGKMGVPVRVWGPGRWPRRMPASVRIERRAVWSREYAMALNSFSIGLGFLTRVVKEESTTRSVEIPACGTFLLAERTKEHTDLFVEGVEAEFFSCDDELAQKVRFYLEHPGRRAEIAAAGRERCIKGRYSHHDKMREMIAEALAVRALKRGTG